MVGAIDGYGSSCPKIRKLAQRTCLTFELDNWQQDGGPKALTGPDPCACAIINEGHCDDCHSSFPPTVPSRRRAEGEHHYDDGQVSAAMLA